MAGIKHKTRAAGTKINTTAVWAEDHEIEGGAIGATEIADGAVTTAKIAANAVTSDKIAPDTVIAADIATGGVGTDELAANAVTSPKLAEGIAQIPATYVIYKKDSTYYARNGTTGANDYSGATAHTVIQATIAAMGNATGRLALKGQFTLVDSIGINDIDQAIFTLDLRQARINAQTAGKPIIDLTGSHDGVRILGGWIYGLEVDAPNVGVLMARKTGGASAGQHCIYDTIFEGYYTKAVIYNYGSEESNFVNVYARNRQASAKVYYITSDNPESITSAFKTIATGDQSMTHLNWYGGHALGIGATSVGVMLRSATTYLFNGMNFYGIMIGATGTAIYFDITNANITSVYLTDVRVTDQEPVYALYAPNAGAARTISKVRMRGGVYQPAAGGKEISLGANVTALEWIVDRTVYFPANRGCTFTVAPSKCKIYHPSYMTENSGAAANVSDGGTIPHGLALTPTYAIATPSIASEFVSVTAKDASNLTVAIKKDDGTPGTQQTIYWCGAVT